MFAKKLLVATVMFQGLAFAQSTTETTLGDWNSSFLDYTQKHFSASYHGEVYGVRRDIFSEDINAQKVNDFKILHNPVITFKPTEDWQVQASAEFKFSDQPKENAGADYPNGFYRGLLTLTRKNILTEKENGLKMDLGIGRRQFNTGAEQSSGGNYALSSYGNNRIFTNLAKTFGKVDSSLLLQYLHNDYKKSQASTWQHSLEVLPTINIPITEQLSYMFNDDIVISTAKDNNTDRGLSMTHEMNLAYLTYQWSDKISTYYQLKYLHSEDFTKKALSKVDYFADYVGISYSFNPKSTVTFEVGSELAHARDGRDGFSKNVLYPELALYLDFAI